MIEKIISGGNCGADRAALDVAIALEIPHGGWCPKGRKASDGRIPDSYNLQETESYEYPPRTEKNVQESDGTIILYRNTITRGCSLTMNLCDKHNKPIYLVDASLLEDSEATFNWMVRNIILWVEEYDVKTLNVAGSRESKAPGIYFLTYEMLESILEEM